MDKISKTEKKITMDDMFVEQMKNLLDQYNENKFCDVVLTAGKDEKKILGHRNMLASVCKYFSTLFNNTPNITEFRIADVDGEILDAIVSFCYSHEVILTDDNYERIFKSASQMQFDSLMKACTILITDKLTAKNCLAYGSLAKNYNCKELSEVVKKFAAENFLEIAKTDEFLKTSNDQVTDLLSISDLNVLTEIDVLDALKLWVNFDMENRKSLIGELFLKINMTQIKNEDLFNEVINWIGPDCKVQKLLVDVLKYKETKELTPQIEQMMKIPRKSIDLILIRTIQDYNTINFKIEKLNIIENLVKEINSKNISYYQHSPNYSDCRAILKDNEVFVISRKLVCFNMLNNTWKDINVDLNYIKSLALSFYKETLYILTYTNNYGRFEIRKLNEGNDTETVYTSQNFSQLYDAVSFNNLIYIAIESNNSSTIKILRFNPQTMEMVNVGSPKAITQNCRLESFKGKLHAIGNSHLVECYDSNENDWKILSEKDAKEKTIEAVIENYSKLIVMYRNKDHKYDLETFHPVNKTWSKIYSLAGSNNETLSIVGVSS